MESIKTIIKRLLSYLKFDWGIDDYPVRTWTNPNAGQADITFAAGIINWSTMVGHGATREEAIDNLKEHFRMYKENGNDLPRPGTKVPIKYASTEQIDKYEDVAIDYFSRVLGMDYHNGFYSDGSILAYFHPFDNEDKAEKMRNKIVSRTLQFYNVDITDIYDEPLYIIFEKIKKQSV